MKKLVSFIYYLLLILFPIYLLFIFYSKFSLAGFWSDIYFILTLITFSIIFVFKRNQLDKWFSRICKTVQLGCLGVCTYFVISNLNSFVFWNRLETRSFMNIACQGKQYNAYFHPVGSYSCGQGNLAISKKIIYLPFLEEELFFVRCIHDPLDENYYDGQKVDHKHLISEIIWEQLVLNDLNDNNKIEALNQKEIKSINIRYRKNSDSLLLTNELKEMFVQQVNNSIDLGMRKSSAEFDITVHLKSGEIRKMECTGNSIKDWKTGDKAYEAKDLSFLKRFWDENEQNIPSRIILKQGNKELSSFERSYEQKWAVKPSVFPYSNYSKIRAFKVDCSGECFKAEFRHRNSEGKEISKKQFDNLMKIVKNPNSYGNSTAACFNPGFALVLYDEKDIPTEFMSFCLDCNSFRTYPGEIDIRFKDEMLYGFSKDARIKLRSFFSDCGVDYQNKSSLFD